MERLRSTFVRANGSTHSHADPTPDEHYRHTIHSGCDGVHGALLALTSRLIGRGMSADDEAATLYALMDGCEWRDCDSQRWSKHRNSIREMVDSAIAKFGDKRERSAPDGEQGAAAADTAPPRFRSLTMLELVSAELPERVPLLAPFLLAQGLVQVHAWRGIGKTHFALGIAYAVATGGRFLRWQAPAAQRVLFIDGEMPAVALKERLDAIIRADDRDIDVDPEMLRLITPDFLDCPPPDLADPDDQAELQRVVAEFDPALIVVDNISTLVRSAGSENDAEAWIPVQTWALRMRRERRAVLFVHHTGKGGKQRGTSKREDVLDAAIALTRPEPYDPADGARFIVAFEKGRYLRGDDARSFEAQLSTDARGLQVWTTKDIDDSTVERAAALYRDGITKVSDIADELGCHKSTVSRALKEARKRGLIPPENA